MSQNLPQILKKLVKLFCVDAALIIRLFITKVIEVLEHH